MPEPSPPADPASIAASPSAGVPGASLRPLTPTVPPPVSIPPKASEVREAFATAKHSERSDDAPSKGRWKGADEVPTPAPSRNVMPKSLNSPVPPPATIVISKSESETPPSLPSRTRRFPAWLISLILHTCLLVALVLIQISNSGSPVQSLVMSFRDPASETAELTVLPVEAIPIEASEDDARNPSETVVDAATFPNEVQPTIKITSPSQSGSNDNALVAMSIDNHAMNELLSSSSGETALPQRLPTGGMYLRSEKSRQALGDRYGATPESEDAVEAALKWLAAHQQPDGSWSFDLSKSPCNGRCRHSQKDFEDSPRPPTAATGLALLAFMGAGYSHHQGIYADNIRKGLYYLREASRESRFGLDLQHGSMYGHGIALLAISEAMAMTRYEGKQDSDLFSLTDRAATFTMVAQHELGGWRYVPGSPGDMTVTAWQVLSLISARHGGVILRTDTLSRAENFVRRLSKENAYEFGYQTTSPEPTTTAVGLCLLLYLGQSPDETFFRRSLDRMHARGFSPTDLYWNYYATLALHHARHPDWATWHEPLRDHLVKTQATEGHEAGSWHFRDRHGDVGGRLYTTAMAAMILEVYYRYLPLYQPRDEFKLD